MLSPNPRIGFIGFGEVAFHMSKGLRQAGVARILACGKALTTESVKNKIMRRRAETVDVELVPTLRELVTHSELIISAAHAQTALEIAKEVAHCISPEAMFADLNNAIPVVKKAEAELINATGASFVDIGLLELPALLEHKALMYVSGNGAEEFKRVLEPFGMNIEVAPGNAGQAATVKALMNIYLKGMQALCIEVALSAHKTAIPLELISSLVSQMTATVPGEDEITFWIQRGRLHARRKTAEVQDIMGMMKQWGVDPLMMAATARRLHATAEYDLEDHIADSQDAENYQSMIEFMDKVGAEQGLDLR